MSCHVHIPAVYRPMARRWECDCGAVVVTDVELHHWRPEERRSRKPSRESAGARVFGPKVEKSDGPDEHLIRGEN